MKLLKTDAISYQSAFIPVLETNPAEQFTPEAKLAVEYESTQHGLEAMSAQLSSQEVKTKAVAAVRSLGIRMIFSLFLRILSSIVMARLLFADDYGAFAVAAWIMGIGAFLSDVGLAGALVRQHQAPTRDEAFTVFISQQVMTGLIAVVVILFGPRLAGVSQLGPSQQSILYVMALNLFNNSLRVIPMMALERELKFGVISKLEMIQSLVNTGVNIFLAWLGWGAWALAWGSVSGAAVITIGVWMASPWKPAGRFRSSIFMRLAKFGLAFQLNALAPTLLSGWIPILVGKYLGLTAVGYFNWAMTQASIPMMLSGILNRVAFPAYARMQGDPEKLGEFLKTSIRRLVAVMGLLVPLGVLVCPAAIPILFRDRWVPAIQLVQWLSFDVLLGTLLGILAASQNATGHALDRLWIALGAGVADWVLGWIAIRTFGFASLGPTVVGATLIEMWFTCWLIQRRHLLIRGLIGEAVRPVLRASLFTAIAFIASIFLANQSINLRCAAGVGVFGVLFLGYELLMRGNGSFHEIRAVFAMIRRRPTVEVTV